MNDPTTQPTLPENPHALSVKKVLAKLGVSPEKGLTSAEARARLATYGHNAIVEQARRMPWRMLLDQFTDLMILVLIAAAVIAGLVGEPQDSIVILVMHHPRRPAGSRRRGFAGGG
ncbi:MAG: cation-transporting P-type ATPase [Alphaproteobacteria bacterium]